MQVEGVTNGLQNAPKEANFIKEQPNRDIKSASVVLKYCVVAETLVTHLRRCFHSFRCPNATSLCIKFYRITKTGQESVVRLCQTLLK